MSFDLFEPLLFGALAVAIIVSGALVVLVPRITSAALLMAFTFLCMGGMFLLLGAETLAAFQVLIYVGAITVLILYGVMFTPQGSAATPLFQRQAPIAALVVAVIAVPVSLIAFTFQDRSPLPRGGDLVPLALSLFRDYTFVFEVASVLLLAALIGAIVLVRRDDEGA